MSTPTVIVHHPIPSTLRALLYEGGYSETSVHDGYSIYCRTNEGALGVDRRDSPSREQAQIKVLLTPEEAAEALSLGRTKVYELIGSGALKSVRVGKSRRIPRDALVELVNQLQAG